MFEEKTRSKVGIFVFELARTGQLYYLYGRDSDPARKSLTKLFYSLEEVLFSEKVFQLDVSAEEISFEGLPYGDISKEITHFIEVLKGLGVLRMTFFRGVSKNDISGFVNVLFSAPAEGAQGIESRLEKLGIKKIAVGSIGPADQAGRELVDSVKLAKETYHIGREILDDVESAVLGGRKIDAESARDYVDSLMRNLISNKSALLILAAVKCHDEHSHIHNINVAIFSILESEALGLDQDNLREIALAALFHDIGKILVPSGILKKESALSDEEFNIVKKHPVYGARVILANPDLGTLPALVAFEHHLRHDGLGYPGRAFSTDQSLASMIVSIADVYDAMRSRRAYAGEMAPEKIYDEMMKMSGKNFNADLLDNFFRIVGIYPPGTLVETDTGEIGLSVNASIVDKRRPHVELLYGSDKNPIDEPRIVSLFEKDPESGGYKRTILHSLIPTKKIGVPERYRGE
ncbi:MAG: HD domain-containing protein [Candidatus Omnitrophica bacterium]|nr:HD domain-containing protein [Candidatus Omnitrophota bacterium]